MLTETQRKQVLSLARQAISEFVSSGTESEPAKDEYLRVPAGVFVTLKIDDELRGCIGFPEARFPLGEAVVKAAIYAATDDPRFPTLTASELAAVRLEVSVLSAARAISHPDEIVVGVHGLILTYGRARGLLLPQVPLEHNWDREQYLRNLCRKAGVPKEAWKDPGAKIEAFTAEVFGEPTFSDE